MAIKTCHEPAFARIKDIIDKNKSFVVLEHENPDGDCAGSGLAMVLALNSLGKRALLVTQDPHPPMYDFLPGRDLYTRAGYIRSEDFRPDVAIFVDCTDPGRVGRSLELAQGAIWINIDHHVSNSGFGDVSIVRPDVAATGEIIFDLLEYMEVPISVDIGTCLYVAILTDTGGFRYQNTTGDTFRLAAKLVDMGVKAHEVAEAVYETRSFSSMLLLGRALESLKLYNGGKVAAVFVTREMMRSTGASDEETEGIINFPRSISGVEVALCFREHDDGNSVHVSFRSRTIVDVSQVAIALGGGGHPRASGTMIQGSIQDVTEKVLKVLNGMRLWKDS